MKTPAKKYVICDGGKFVAGYNARHQVVTISDSIVDAKRFSTINDAYAFKHTHEGCGEGLSMGAVVVEL